MPVFALPSDGSESLKLDVRRLQHGGLERSYNLYLPSSYDSKKAAPLLLLLHGGGGIGKRMVNFTGFDKIAKENGLIIVCPEGFERHWNDGRDSKSSAHQKNIDDVGFFCTILDLLDKEFSIDKSRVYASGISNGAMMSYRLAHDIPDRITAIGTVVGALPEPLSREKWTGRPVPTIMVNGTADPLVPFHGGEVQFYRKKLGRVISVPATAEFLAKHNECRAEPKIMELTLTQHKSGMKVVKTEYADCCNHANVDFYSVEGGGHTWPRDSRLAQYAPALIIGKACKDFDCTELIWSFFQKHTMVNR